MILRRTLGYRAVLAGTAVSLAAAMAIAPGGAFADENTDAQDGAVNWAAFYNQGGTGGLDNNFSSNGKDAFESSVTLKDGTVVAAGLLNHSRTDQKNERGASDASLVFYNADGTVKKAVTFGGSLTEGFEKVIATSDGGVVAVGWSSSVDGDLDGVITKDKASTGDTDAVICKFNGEGELIKTQKFGGTTKDLFRDVVELDDGSFVAVGYTGSDDGDLTGQKQTGTHRNGLIVKYSADLASSQLVDLVGGTGGSDGKTGMSKFDEIKSVVKGLDGGIVVAGFENSDTGDFAKDRYGHSGEANTADGFIAVYNDNFERIGVQTVGGEGDDYLTDLEYDYQNSDGSFSDTPTGYVLSGYTASNSGDFQNANANEQESAFLLRTDKNGKVLAKAVYSSTEKSYGESVKSFGNGYLLAGEFTGNLNAVASSPSAAAKDVFVAYVQDSANSLQITKATTLGGSQDDLSRSLDTGAAGIVNLTGRTQSDDFAGFATPEEGDNVALIASLNLTGLLPESVTADVTAVTASLNALPEASAVTAGDAESIQSARTAYDALSNDLKSLIPAASVQKLADAEAQIAAFQAVAKPVSDAIAALPSTAQLKLTNAAAVTAAQKAYDALNANEKAFVSNYNALTQAQAQIAKLQKAADTAAAKAKAQKAAAAAAKAKKQATVTVNVKTVTASAVAKAVKKAGSSKAKVTTIVLGSKVKTVKAKAFKAYAKVKTVTVKSKKLTKKGVKNALKGSKVKTVKVSVSSKAKTNKKYVKKYKKIFTKANVGKKVTVKAAK